jgi:hypothetical protein
MKKTVLFGLTVALVAAFAFSGVVFAQGPVGPQGDPTTCPNCLSADGSHYVHDYLISYASQTLGLTVDEIEAQLDEGKTLAQIAFDAGVEDYRSFILDARAYVNEQLVAEGIVIPGWNNTNGQAGYRMQAAAGTCLNADGTGTPQPIGRSFRGGRQ